MSGGHESPRCRNGVPSGWLRKEVVRPVWARRADAHGAMGGSEPSRRHSRREFLIDSGSMVVCHDKSQPAARCAPCMLSSAAVHPAMMHPALLPTCVNHALRSRQLIAKTAFMGLVLKVLSVYFER